MFLDLIAIQTKKLQEVTYHLGRILYDMKIATGVNSLSPVETDYTHNKIPVFSKKDSTEVIRKSNLFLGIA